jgi:hypothetical protein
MKTKAQCIFERVMSTIEYGNNVRLGEMVVQSYNAGKQYSSDMLFLNDEKGLDAGLEGYSPSFIVYSLIGEDSSYNTKDPFFVIENGIRSLDAYDVERMLDEDGWKRVTSWDVVQFLDESDMFDAFESFIYFNYPQEYRSINTEALEDYSTEQFFEANWDELAKSLMQQQVNEGRVLEMTEEELRTIVSEGAKEAYARIKEGKSGIHIDPENKGKFTATKERTGKSTEELTHSKNPLTRKRAIFAQNAKKWNHSK